MKRETLLKEILLKNPYIKVILKRTPKLKFSNWYLGAGCIAQTVWNYLSDNPLYAHIGDYDLVYFDNGDISEQTENKYRKKAEKVFKDLPIEVELVNEARVHTWYEQEFGKKIKQYISIENAIASWPTTATSIGVRLNDQGNFVIYTPFGLDDLFNMVVRANKKQITKEIYLKKVNKWTKYWPNLVVIPILNKYSDIEVKE